MPEPKKVYIVTSGTYSDYRILRPFSGTPAGKQLAEAFVASGHPDLQYANAVDIQEWILDMPAENRLCAVYIAEAKMIHGELTVVRQYREYGYLEDQVHAPDWRGEATIEADGQHGLALSPLSFAHAKKLLVEAIQAEKRKLVQP